MKLKTKLRQQKNKLSLLLMILALVAFGLAGLAHAGNLNPSSQPAATSYTLGDIYQRLTTNQTAQEADHNIFPSSTPVATFYTLKQIYEAIPTIAGDMIKLGTSYLGISGTLTPDGGTAGVADLFNGKTVHLTDDWTLDTGTLNLACNTATFDGAGNLVTDAYDGDGSGSDRWCMKDTGDAGVAEILFGKIGWVNGEAVTGTMTNVGGQTITPTTSNQTITQGYHDGTGYAEGDADLTAGNIKESTSIFGVTGTYAVDYPGGGWTPNGSGDGSTELTESACSDASGWEWFEDANGDGDTSDPEDGICVKTSTEISANWGGTETTDNSYIVAYTCSGSFPNGIVATGPTGCALCVADCYDGCKDLPDNAGYTAGGYTGPITPEVLKNWTGTRLPDSKDFFGFCGYKDTAGDSDYETECSSLTTHGNYGQMIGRTDECMDLSNSSYEWLSEQHSSYSARVAGGHACSDFAYNYVYGGNRFRAVFRP